MDNAPRFEDVAYSEWWDRPVDDLPSFPTRWRTTWTPRAAQRDVPVIRRQHQRFLTTFKGQIYQVEAFPSARPGEEYAVELRAMYVEELPIVPIGVAGERVDRVVDLVEEEEPMHRWSCSSRRDRNDRVRRVLMNLRGAAATEVL